MSRNEGKIGEDGDERVDAADILAALASDVDSQLSRRRGAVRCYLSASEGWRDALSVLGGAFASNEPWLKAKKEE